MKYLASTAFIAVASALVIAFSPGVHAQDTVTIGLSQPNLEHPYRVGGTARAETWAAEHDNVSLVVIDGRRDSAVQLNALEDLMTRGVNAIVMSPNDSDALAPIADQAERAGIPLIIFDRKLNVPEEKYAAFIGADNVEMGRVAARYLIDAIGGSGKIIQIEGTPGASATTDRKAGFEEVVAEHDGVEFVSYVGHYRLHEAVAVMEDAIVAHPDVVAVYAHNDSMALGAAQVLDERGKTDLAIVGMDGGQEGCDGIASGQLTGSVYYPTMMPEALELAMKVIAGEEVQKNTLLNTPIITQENYAEFCK